MRLLEDFWNPRGKWTLGDRFRQLRPVQLRHVFAGEPVVGLAEQVVAHLSPVHEVEAFCIRPQAQDFHHVHLAGHIHEVRQTFVPAGAPIGSEHAVHLGAQARFDGRDDFRRVGVVF